MRIATFNLENLDLSEKADPPLADRLPILRPQLARLDADILCLQEVNAQAPTSRRHGERHFDALDSLLEETPYATYERVSTETRGRHAPLDVHNLVTLSRWPVTDSRQYWNDLVPPPLVRRTTALPAETDATEVRWDRPLLYSVIAPPGAPPLHVFNLHLRAPLASAIPGQKESAFVWKSVPGWAEGYHLAAIKRNGQALETRLAIDSVFDDDPAAEVIVCGDMNAELREMPLRILCADAEDTGNGRLAARSLVPLETRLPQTVRYSVVHAGRPLLLDHILVSRALALHSAGMEIHNETLGDEVIGYAAVHHSPESYHAPIVAEFDRA